MSGGGNRKKNTHSQGWEEAGSEFYQESYPLDGDTEIWQNDPKRLATLLPSKQTRAVAATIRMKNNDFKTANRTVRRHQRTMSYKGSVNRRTSTIAGDTQDSMLPDLSEMSANEETAWEEVMRIKEYPVPMSQKKEMKAKIMNAQTLRLQGYEQFNWKRRKLWSQMESYLREISHKLELWRGSMKHIEGNFGTGIVTYFLFLKWLFFLNLSISSFIVLFLMLPTILIDNKEELNNSNCTDTVDCCSAKYFNSSDTDNFILIDLVQGTGVLERTVLFYGYYSNKILDYKVGDFTLYYNVPLAYLALGLLYFLFSLFLIIRTSAKGFRDRLVEGEGQFYQYCNLVFGGWDFCINNDRSARIKHKAIFNDLKGTLEMEKLEEERQNRTAQEKSKLYFCRVLINLLILIILASCAVGIYFLFGHSTSQLNLLRNNSTVDEWEKLAYEFLPSITIVTMNIIVPIIFSFLISFEKYSPIFEIRFTLFRTVFLRLASLVVFYASFKRRVSCEENTEDLESECLPCLNEEPVPTCWETFVGQQIYKLLLTDFGTHIVLTFLLNFLRSLLAKHVDNKFFKFIGEQTFMLPKHALDVVYTQTLCWFGIFYAPLISVMATIIFFFMFYIKKFACVINSKPTPIVYKASRSNSMFMLVLLVSYMFALFPIAYSVSEMLPSKSCGPFRGRESVWSLIVKLFTDWPTWIQECIYFLSTAGFAIPLFIILLLLLYYYSAVNSANRHMVHILKNQLVLEGHDKQFLLDRLSYFIKQESQKRARTEQNRDRGRDRST